MGEVFYEAFRYSRRPGKLLEALAQPFPNASPYVERIMDTLTIARTNNDLALGKTLCTLCDCALRALPKRDKTSTYELQTSVVRCKRALRGIRSATNAYLMQHGVNGNAPKDEYAIRDENELPASLPSDLKTFIEVQRSLPPVEKKRKKA